jgi:AcrR family transcriptional regulator
MRTHEMVAYTTVAPNPELTRRDLVAAAEELFAARGIEGVSLREINATAGQKNATALQYHFGDRDGLLRAVLAKHHPTVEALRHELLDAYEAQHGRRRAPTGDLRALAIALVEPSAAKLSDPDGGRAFLRIQAQLLNRPEFGDRVREDDRASIHRWRGLVGPLLPDVAVRRLHHRFTAIRVSATELARRAAGSPRRDERLFTSHLVDLVTALLATPVSDETAALLAGGRRHGVDEP